MPSGDINLGEQSPKAYTPAKHEPHKNMIGWERVGILWRIVGYLCNFAAALQICIDKKEILKKLRFQKSRISIAILAQASASARAW